MILTADYHTHTPYSHGKNTVAENAAAAVEKGLKQIGIADHGFSHVAFGIRRRQVSAYKAECEAASKQYGIDVLVGIEANIRGIDGKADLTDKDFENFDLYLCGKHVFIWYDRFSDMIRYGGGNLNSGKKSKTPSKKLVEFNTKAYISVIKNNPIDAVSHLNYLCPANALEVAKCAADYGTYIELNSKKNHLTDEELNDIAVKTSARFIIDSDAHSKDRVGDMRLVEEQISRLNFPIERIDNVDGRLPNFRFTAYKKKM
ncbi:MAG: PHP domain-containing protein [Clostridiales bacterium]|nr:PHP domain-containing protein [Clostridiales bacterium]